MPWKIQEICSKMGTKIFGIDEEMAEIIAAKVGNPQNSTSKKWANWSQPWNLAFFQDYIFKKYVHFQSQRVPKWKIAHIWQSKEHKNNKITPKNVSQKGLQSLTDVLQHPVDKAYIHGRMLLTTHLTLQHRHADLESGESLPLASIFTWPWWQSDRSCCIR